MRVASYVLVAPKPLKTSSLGQGFGLLEFLIRLSDGFKNNSAEGMELREKTTRKKGGRPRKAARKEHVLALKCSLFEKKAIAINEIPPLNWTATKIFNLVRGRPCG